jgi:hypothetical protein
LNIKLVANQVEENQKRVKMITLVRRKDGELFEVPASKRGNSTYAWRAGKQLAVHKKMFLQGLVDYSVMFITLVVPNGNSYCACRDSWKAISKAIGLYIRALKRLGAIKHIAVLESNSEGSCHAHIILSWNKPLQVKFFKEKYYLAEKDLSESIRKKWIDEWRKVSGLALNKKAVAIRICPNQVEADKTFDYVVKYQGQGSDITSVLSRVKGNRATSHDIARLLTNFWANKLNIRLYRATKKLKMQDSCLR